MGHARFDASAANARAFVTWFGYTPWQALAASTIESAESLPPRPGVGALRRGRVADLLSVAGDPAQDVAAGRPVKLGGRPLV